LVTKDAKIPSVQASQDHLVILENCEKPRGRPTPEGKPSTLCGKGKACGTWLTEELLRQLFSRQAEIGSYVAEDLGKCANLELFVGWDRNMMLRALELRRNSDMAARLTGDLVTKMPQSSNQFFAANITGKLQAGITSSLTM
jgi:hypothetical protein